MIQEERKENYDSINLEGVQAVICNECGQRPFMHYCNCEPIKYLCSFCARRHWRVMQPILQENHVFTGGQTASKHPIPTFFENESIRKIAENAFQIKQSTEVVKIFIKEQKNTYKKKPKNIPSQITELEGKINSLEKYDTFNTYCGCNSVKQNLYELKKFGNELKEVWKLFTLIKNESNILAEESENIVFSIDVKLGNFNSIDFMTNLSSNLSFEEMMTVLRTFLIMKSKFNYQFKLENVRKLLKLYNENTIGIKADEIQVLMIGKMYPAIIAKDCSFEKEYFDNLIGNYEKDPYNISKRLLLISYLWINIDNQQLFQTLCQHANIFVNWDTDSYINDAHYHMLQAWDFIWRKNYEDAEAKLKSCLFSLYESVGENHPLISECMLMLASCYININNNRYECALKLMEKALEIQMENQEWYEIEAINELLGNIRELNSSILKYREN